VAGYHEQVGELTARILAHVDLAGMSMAERVDLMTALSELAACTPPTAARQDAIAPSMAVRHPACTPPAPGGCAAGYVEKGLAHCCIEPPNHLDSTLHRCACGGTWDEVRAQHVDGACGLVHQKAGADHGCVCRLAVHNLIAGPDMIDRPLHACADCSESWTAP
jgi:hypothetical protein